MRLKSFFSDRVQEALSAAQADMGPDAVLVSSHRTAAESRHLGQFEVVCGVFDNGPARPASRVELRQQARVQTPRYAQSLPPKLSHANPIREAAAATAPQWVSELRSHGYPAPLLEEILRDTGSRLEARGFDVKGLFSSEAICSELSAILPLLDGGAAVDIPRLSRPGPKASAADLRAALQEELLSRLQPTVPPRTSVVPNAHVLVLTGPGGGGKSMLAVRIAVAANVFHDRPVRFLNIASSTAGATARLTTLASVLDFPCQSLQDPAELAAACQPRAENELLIIDLPGFTPRQAGSRDAWAAALESLSGAEVCLVLPATMKPADLHASLELNRMFQPNVLAFTHLDVASSIGSCLAFAIAANLPPVYQSEGQTIPDDIELIDATQFTGRALTDLSTAVEAHGARY
jgi:flagellar biosynthesis protein FlhF